VGRFRVEERLLAMVVTKIIMPRGSNHATLNKGDLVVMYCMQNVVMVDWTYTIRDHMMKAKRPKDFKLPYVVLISKFIEHFGVDVEGELEESTELLNHVSTLNMHKMRFTKVGNTWLVEGDQGANIEVGANDHEAGTSGGNQEEDEPQPMQLSCTTLIRIMDLHTPNLREWFSTSFKTSTWHKIHIMHNAQQGSKTWITSCIMFMTSSPMSTTGTILGMSEGDGS